MAKHDTFQDLSLDPQMRHAQPLWHWLYSQLRGVILNGRALPSARLAIGPGCVYNGAKSPQFQGGASVSGSFTASSAAV